MSAPSSAARPVFVCYRLDPARGIERAVAGVVHLMGVEPRPSVLVIRGGVAPELRPMLAGAPVLTGWTARRELLRLVHRRSTDAAVVVAAGLWAAMVIRLLRPVPPRIVIWEHSIIGDRVDREPRWRMYLRLSRSVYRRASAVVCVSEGVSRAMAPLVGPTTTRSVIPNPPTVEDAPRPSRPTDDCGVELLSIGALIPRKNHQLAVHTLSLLPSRYTLTILGEGDERAPLTALAEQLGVAARVSMPGHIAHVEPALQRTDVLLHCAHVETYGLAVMEAGIHDVPVVALRAPGVDELIPDLVVGTLIDRPDPVLMAAHVTSYVERTPPRATFDGARAQRQVASPAAIGAAWRTLIAQVLDGADGRP